VTKRSRAYTIVKPVNKSYSHASILLYTAVYKLIKRLGLSACKFVSRSKKYRTRSERKFGLKRTERSQHSLEPWV